MLIGLVSTRVVSHRGMYYGVKSSVDKSGITPKYVL